MPLMERRGTRHNITLRTAMRSRPNRGPGMISVRVSDGTTVYGFGRRPSGRPGCFPAAPRRKE